MTKRDTSLRACSAPEKASPAEVPLTAGAEIDETPSRKRASIPDACFSAGPFRIWSGARQSGLRAQAAKSADSYAICLFSSEPFTLDLEARRFNNEPEIAVAGNVAEILQNSIQEERRCLTLAFGKDIVLKQLSALIGAPLLKRPNLFAAIDQGSATFSKICALSALLWSILVEERERRASARLTELLSYSILVVLLQDLPHNYSPEFALPASPAIPKYVKRAIEFMIANVSQPITIKEIAQASNVSKRTLQLGFSSFHGMTPLLYLRRIRLQGAHEELSRGEATVADIARRWGFTHAGHFTTYYREAFGETPSDTARWSRKDL